MISALAAFFRAVAAFFGFIDREKTEAAGVNKAIVRARRSEDARVDAALAAEHAVLDEFDRAERERLSDDKHDAG